MNFLLYIYHILFFKIKRLVQEFDCEAAVLWRVYIIYLPP